MAERVRWTYEVASSLAHECDNTENALRDLARALNGMIASFDEATEGDTQKFVHDQYDGFKPFLESKLPDFLGSMRDYINKKNEQFAAIDG